MDDFRPPQEVLRALSYADLRALGVPFTVRWLAKMEAKGQFPKRYKITRRRVAWDGEAVMAWLRAKRDGNVETPAYHDERVARGQWVPRRDLPIARAVGTVQPALATDRIIKPAVPLPEPPRRVAAPVPRGTGIQRRPLPVPDDDDARTQRLIEKLLAYSRQQSHPH